MRKYDKYDDLIVPLSDELNVTRSRFPVTIVYMDSLESLGYCFQFLSANLRDPYEPKDHQIPENRLFAMFHKDYTPKMKSHIIEDMRKENPKTRLLLATVALGMGFHSPSVERIIHFRPPTTLEKYLQETGRAGRAGQQATALLYYNNSDIASNRPGFKPEMRAYCKNTTSCLRLHLLSYFGFKTTIFTGEKSLCCSNCKTLSN